MRWRISGVLCLGTALWVGCMGCSSAHESAAAAGGSAGASVRNAAGSEDSGGASGGNVAGASSLGGAGGTMGRGGASAVGGAGSANSPCLAHPPAQRSQGTLLSLSLVPLLADKPFLFGEANALGDGGEVIPTNLRFYVSAVQLLQSGGEPLAVDIVTATGEPEPYGVHLFNAELEASSTLRLLAPAGEYTGLSFSLGIALACNQQNPTSLAEPLDNTSQMTWPHTGGFLFLRYEGRNMPAPGGSSTIKGVPTAVHMGGSIQRELVPRVTVQGPLSVPVTGALAKILNVSMSEIFSAATSDLDVSDFAVGLFSEPETIAGERLRRQLAERQVFVLAPR